MGLGGTQEGDVAVRGWGVDGFQVHFPSGRKECTSADPPPSPSGALQDSYLHPLYSLYCDGHSSTGRLT
jgi:hypothetical protein